MTGFYRDGYCRTGATDAGDHAVAGVVSDEFLDFSAARGNDLRAGAGLRGGCRWCLCTGRWLEAFRAFEAGRVPRTAVPRVDLEATEDSALRRVDLQTLRGFAVEREAQVNGVNGVVNGTNGASV